MTIDSRRAMSLWQTVRIAARTWRRTPALAAVIMGTLALGIGATTAAFTIAYSILVRPFPFPDAGRLVWITTHDSRSADNDRPVIGSNRLPQFADWQRSLTTVEQIGAWAGDAPDVFTVTGAGTPERVSGLRVTHELLTMLGAMPATGRLFRSGDDVPGAAQTVVLSHGYWQRRFAARNDIVGRSITIEHRSMSTFRSRSTATTTSADSWPSSAGCVQESPLLRRRPSSAAGSRRSRSANGHG
jgi:hypothetical protein